MVLQIFLELNMLSAIIDVTGSNEFIFKVLETFCLRESFNASGSDEMIIGILCIKSLQDS